MKIKTNRIASFIVIAIVYIFACAVGIVTYHFLPPNELWFNLLIADIVATAFVFVFSVILKNASVYDPYWSVQPIVILYAFAFVYGANVTGILILVAVSFWGVRLTANWAYTFKNLTCQDWRYTMLKENTKGFYPIINFVGIHLVPTLVVYACTLPAVYTLLIRPAINAGAVIFFIISIGAVLLQGTADIQMHKYRKNRTTPFIRSGIWKYSRHPNYLAEIIMWWAIGLQTICVIPSIWYFIFGAVLNTMLFVFVSIPLADGRQKTKPGFSDYKAQTFALLPIKKPKRK